MQTVTKRTLTKWRREALTEVYVHQEGEDEVFSTDRRTWCELHQRILRLTLILLDQELMKGK